MQEEKEGKKNAGKSRIIRTVRKKRDKRLKEREGKVEERQVIEECVRKQKVQKMQEKC